MLILFWRGNLGSAAGKTAVTPSYRSLAQIAVYNNEGDKASFYLVR
jgi:hypothetical protein